jgi:hypothetical protein
VRNPLALATTLTAIRAFVEGAAPGIVSWGVGEPIDGLPTTAIRVAFPEGGHTFQFALHYAVVKDALLLTPHAPTLAKLVRAVTAGVTAKVAELGAPGATQAHLGLELGAPGSALRRTLDGLLDQESARQTRAALEAAEVLARGLGTLPTGAALREAGLGYLGFEPASVQGGALGRDGRGHLASPVYGSVVAPRVPALPVAEAPLTQLMAALRALSAGVAIEGQGRDRGLHITFEWARR